MRRLFNVTYLKQLSVHHDLVCCPLTPQWHSLTLLSFAQKGEPSTSFFGWLINIKTPVEVRISTFEFYFFLRRVLMLGAVLFGYFLRQFHATRDLTYFLREAVAIHGNVYGTNNNGGR